jgi:HEPN domain-containing protein
MNPPHNLNHEHAVLMLRKAGEDEALLDEVTFSARISNEIFGFHCQQAAEKLLKAVLAIQGIVYRRTHDLDELLGLIHDAGIDIPQEFIALDQFIPFAVEYRYQEWGSDAVPFDRLSARDLLLRLRVWVEGFVLGEAAE